MKAKAAKVSVLFPVEPLAGMQCSRCGALGVSIIQMQGTRESRYCGEDCARSAGAFDWLIANAEPVATGRAKR